MTIAILISVFAGALFGYFLFPQELAVHMDLFTTIALNLLIFSVGIDVGINRGVFKELKKHGWLILMIPASIIVGSALGGLVTGFFFDLPANLSLSVAAGYGWYSLSGILLSNLHTPEIGTVAFLTNVFRELFTVMTIPFIAKHLNHYTTIAPAGATSMDSTLPIISNYTGPEIAVISFFNGALLTALVPVLVPFFYYLG